MTKRKPPRARVVMGPDPHFAHCTGCQGTVPMPVLPAPIPAVLLYTKYAEALHRDCREAVPA